MGQKGGIRASGMGALPHARRVAGRLLRARAMRWVLAALLPALPIVSSAAGPETVTLQWDAPAECPDRALVEAKIAAAVGASEGAGAVSAEAKVERVGDVYRLHLVTQSAGGRGERTIDDPSCVALADATALIVTLAVDPTLAGGLAPSASASESVAPPASSAPPTPSVGPVASASVRPPPRPSAAPPPAPPPTRVAVGAGVSALVGPLPNAALAVSGGVALLRGPFRFELEGRWAPRSDRPIDTRPGAGGRFDLLTGALGAQYLVVRGPFEVGPRLALEAGMLRGRAFGVEIPLDGRSLWIAGEAGASAFYRAGPLAFRLDSSAIVPFIRPEFVIEGLGSVHRPSPVGARVSLGAEVRF